MHEKQETCFKVPMTSLQERQVENCLRCGGTEQARARRWWPFSCTQSKSRAHGDVRPFRLGGQRTSVSTRPCHMANCATPHTGSDDRSGVLHADLHSSNDTAREGHLQLRLRPTPVHLRPYVCLSGRVQNSTAFQERRNSWIDGSLCFSETCTAIVTACHFLSDK
jgi:hypothetical protein